jgi:Mycothiol maleylpyruvate isomerase N-terminal domain
MKTPMGAILPEAICRCKVSETGALQPKRIVDGVPDDPVSLRPESKLVLRASAECNAFLTAQVDKDWAQPIPQMTWDVAHAVAHIAAGLLWYTADLAAGLPELSTMELKVKEDSGPQDLIRSIETFALTLGAVIDAVAPGARGFHPAGNPDASGFAAIACDELLIHTDDAARGLGVDFTPTSDVAEATLRRIFPWAPTDLDPWKALRWANGRIDIDGLESAKNWRWHCAPLDEWDGTDPNDSG